VFGFRFNVRFGVSDLTAVDPSGRQDAGYLPNLEQRARGAVVQPSRRDPSLPSSVPDRRAPDLGGGLLAQITNAFGRDIATS